MQQMYFIFFLFSFLQKDFIRVSDSCYYLCFITTMNDSDIVIIKIVMVILQGNF